jgi:hypothetical protein
MNPNVGDQIQGVRMFLFSTAVQNSFGANLTSDECLGKNGTSMTDESGVSARRSSGCMVPYLHARCISSRPGAILTSVEFHVSTTWLKLSLQTNDSGCEGV